MSADNDAPDSWLELEVDEPAHSQQRANAASSLHELPPQHQQPRGDVRSEGRDQRMFRDPRDSRDARDSRDSQHHSDRRHHHNYEPRRDDRRSTDDRRDDRRDGRRGGDEYHRRDSHGEIHAHGHGSHQNGVHDRDGGGDRRRRDHREREDGGGGARRDGRERRDHRGSDDSNRRDDRRDHRRDDRDHYPRERRGSHNAPSVAAASQDNDEDLATAAAAAAAAEPESSSEDEEEEPDCPLCMEKLDATDKQFKPCVCGYQVCLWCFPAGTPITLACGATRPIESFAATGEQGGGELIAAYDVPEEGVADAAAASSTGMVLARSTALLHQGKKPLLELTLEDGQTLRCTPDHRLLVSDIRTGGLLWTPANQIDTLHQRLRMSVRGPVADIPAAASDVDWRFICSDDVEPFSFATSAAQQRSLAFARLSGVVSYSPRVTFASLFDAQAFREDVALVTGQRHACSDSGHLDASVPAPLIPAAVALPAFLARCPMQLKREFLASFISAHLLSVTASASFAPVAEDFSGLQLHLTVEQLQLLSPLLLEFGLSAASATLDIASSIRFAERVGLRFSLASATRVEVAVSFWRSQQLSCTVPLRFDEYVHRVDAEALFFSPPSKDSTTATLPRTYSLSIASSRLLDPSDAVPVYDLVVQSSSKSASVHSFVANAVLAHNCFHHIAQNLGGKCPACRRDYDPTKQMSADPAVLEMIASATAAGGAKPRKARGKDKEKAEKELQQQKASASSATAADSSSQAGKKGVLGGTHGVRVLQRNLLYVIGLPQALAKEDLLRKREYFGKFGRIVKVALNSRRGDQQQEREGEEREQRRRDRRSNRQTCTLYVTYKRGVDVQDAIRAVNGSIVLGCLLRATYGTSKYCANYLRGQACVNPACLYLHDPSEAADGVASGSGSGSLTEQQPNNVYPQAIAANGLPGATASTNTGTQQQSSSSGGLQRSGSLGLASHAGGADHDDDTGNGAERAPLAPTTSAPSSWASLASGNLSRQSSLLQQTTTSSVSVPSPSLAPQSSTAASNEAALNGDPIQIALSTASSAPKAPEVRKTTASQQDVRRNSVDKRERGGGRSRRSSVDESARNFTPADTPLVSATTSPQISATVIPPASVSSTLPFFGDIGRSAGLPPPGMRSQSALDTGLNGTSPSSSEFTLSQPQQHAQGQSLLHSLGPVPPRPAPTPSPSPPVTGGRPPPGFNRPPPGMGGGPPPGIGVPMQSSSGMPGMGPPQGLAPPQQQPLQQPPSPPQPLQQQQQQSSIRQPSIPPPTQGAVSHSSLSPNGPVPGPSTASPSPIKPSLEALTTAFPLLDPKLIALLAQVTATMPPSSGAGAGNSVSAAIAAHMQRGPAANGPTVFNPNNSIAAPPAVGSTPPVGQEHTGVHQQQQQPLQQPFDASNRGFIRGALQQQQQAAQQAQAPHSQAVPYATGPPESSPFLTSFAPVFGSAGGKTTTLQQHLPGGFRTHIPPPAGIVPLQQQQRSMEALSTDAFPLSDPMLLAKLGLPTPKQSSQPQHQPLQQSHLSHFGSAPEQLQQQHRQPQHGRGFSGSDWGSGESSSVSAGRFTSVPVSSAVSGGLGQGSTLERWGQMTKSIVDRDHALHVQQPQREAEDTRELQHQQQLVARLQHHQLQQQQQRMQQQQEQQQLHHQPFQQAQESRFFSSSSSVVSNDPSASWQRQAPPSHNPQLHHAGSDPSARAGGIGHGLQINLSQQASVHHQHHSASSTPSGVTSSSSIGGGRSRRAFALEDESVAQQEHQQPSQSQQQAQQQRVFMSNDPSAPGWDQQAARLGALNLVSQQQQQQHQWQPPQSQSLQSGSSVNTWRDAPADFQQPQLAFGQLPPQAQSRLGNNNQQPQQLSPSQQMPTTPRAQRGPLSIQRHQQQQQQR